MSLGLSKKEMEQLEQRIALCDSFINREIDVGYYKSERERLAKQLLELRRRRSILFKLLSSLGFFLVFVTIFFVVYYILSQLI